MNLLSIYTLFQSILSMPLSLNSTYMNKYNNYIQEYNKNFSYTNFEIFKKNKMIIDSFNSNNESYTLELNQFADINNFHSEIYKPKNDHRENHIFTEMIIPISVDWRKNNAVTDVKNQGECGSCWAFSTTGSIEGLIAIKTGKLYNISEQQLIDCSSKEGNNGCQGGLMENGFQYVIDNNGSCSEKEYPYTANQGECQQCKNIVKIDNYTDISPNDEKVLKQAVAQQPVSVAIQANLKSFQLYSRGVYSDPDCGDQLDHGVLVVGYGYDYKNNMDYWIVKNSWGPDWGENGYIRIQRNINKKSGLCGIAIQPTIPLL